MNLTLTVETPKTSNLYRELSKTLPDELLGNPYRTYIDELSNGHVLIMVTINLIYRNDVKKYLITEDRAGKTVYGLNLPGLYSDTLWFGKDASNLTKLNTSSFRLKNEFPTRVPYIANRLLATMMPWETYNDLLAGFSYEIQLDVFMALVADLVYMDCEGIVKAKTPRTKTKRFIEAVDSDFKEFVERIISLDMVDMNSIFAYANCRVDAGGYLNSTIKK